MEWCQGRVYIKLSLTALKHILATFFVCPLRVKTESKPLNISALISLSMSIDKKFTRRELLESSCKAVLGLAAYSALGPLLPEANAGEYKEIYLDDEKDFKDVIADSGLCWVMYTWDGQTADPEVQERGQKFWHKIKTNFGHQVDYLITINTTNWTYNDGHNEAIDEIGENSFPSFLLYRNGEVVEGDRGYPVKVQGAPKENSMNNMINYMKEHTILK